MSSNVPRVSRGFRTGIVLGLVIAALGIAVGTVTGATTPFQQVVVVNPPSSPIPVVGTVNVGNNPANQGVTVSNFPASQVVTGSLAETTKVTRVYDEFQAIEDGESVDFVFPQVINTSMLRVQGDTDDVLVSISVNGESVEWAYGDTPFREDFTVPVPITKVHVLCLNVTLDCSITVSAFGY
jgi:hypothetical protein